jgi:hypothetical protein
MAMNPTSINSERAFIKLPRQLLKEEPRMRISSRQKINLMPRHPNLAFIFFMSRVDNLG